MARNKRKSAAQACTARRNKGRKKQSVNHDIEQDNVESLQDADATTEAPHTESSTVAIVTPVTSTATRGSQSKQSSKKAKDAKHGGPEHNIRLADKAYLKREDVRCPICWSTMIEPTTLPCGHSLCMECFMKHVAETSLYCPCCRHRISLWTRNATKQKKLLDEKLWARIRTEFPKLVEARLQNNDTQDIMDGMDSDMPELSPARSESLLNTSISSMPQLDGTLCTAPGEVKQEYEKILQQHKKDLEVERLKEESASSYLIRQIEQEEVTKRTKEEEDRKAKEEEDFRLAQKLQEEEAKQKKSAVSTRNAQQGNLPRRNLMSEWISSNNETLKAGSPELKELPKSKSQTVRQSKPTKKPVKRLLTSSPWGKPVPKVSRASQEVMKKFLDSQDSQYMFSEEDGEPMPSTSKGFFHATAAPCSPGGPNIPKQHDIHLSAFSPTKSSVNARFNIFNPSADSLATPSPASAVDTSVEETPCSSSSLAGTPDSINCEVDRHFKPIKSAPKTPPRRRPDGTFLPEPKLLRMTPLKQISSSIFIANIDKEPIASVSTPPKIETSTPSKPSCATMEKRISNDSGRASDTEMEVESPGEVTTFEKVTNNGVTPSVPVPNCDPTDRGGASSDDYRVTPEDTLNKKPLSIMDHSPNSKSPKTKTEPVHLGYDDNHIDIPPMEEDVQVKEEPISQPPKVKMEVECSQGIITLDEDDKEYCSLEQMELEKFRIKKEQEEEDRKFALQLQRQLNRQEASSLRASSSRSKESNNRYSLRTWLKTEPRQTRSMAKK